MGCAAWRCASSAHAWHGLSLGARVGRRVRAGGPCRRWQRITAAAAAAAIAPAMPLLLVAAAVGKRGGASPRCAPAAWLLPLALTVQRPLAHSLPPTPYLRLAAASSSSRNPTLLRPPAPFTRCPTFLLRTRAPPLAPRPGAPSPPPAPVTRSRLSRSSRHSCRPTCSSSGSSPSGSSARVRRCASRAGAQGIGRGRGRLAAWRAAWRAVRMRGGRRTPCQCTTQGGSGGRTLRSTCPQREAGRP